MCFFRDLVSYITDTVCSHLVFACIMEVITDCFMIFANTMKSHTIEFLNIIIIIKINIKFYSIAMKLSGTKFIIMVIVVLIIKIIKSCSISMKFSDIKFLNIIIIIAIMITVIIAIINIMKLCFANMVKFVIIV